MINDAFCNVFSCHHISSSIYQCTTLLKSDQTGFLEFHLAPYQYQKMLRKQPMSAFSITSTVVPSKLLNIMDLMLWENDGLQFYSVFQNFLTQGPTWVTKRWAYFKKSMHRLLCKIIVQYTDTTVIVYLQKKPNPKPQLIFCSLCHLPCNAFCRFWRRSI